MSSYKRLTKPKSSAWMHFKCLSEGDGGTADETSVERYQCIYCDSCYSGHATRLANHLARGCRRCPKSVTREFAESLKFKKKRKAVKVISVENGFEGVSENENKEEEFSPFLEQSNEAPNRSESALQLEANTLYARACYSANLPLDFAENDFWREFLRVLEPSFKIPSKESLAQEMLNQEYQHVEATIRDRIWSASVIGLQCLLTADKAGNITVNILSCTPKPLYYKSISVGSKDEIGLIVENEIGLLIEEYGSSKFQSLMTNDIAVMEATHVLSVEYPHMVRYFCASHSLHQLADDICQLEPVSSLVTNLQAIIEELNDLVSPPIIIKSPTTKFWQSIFSCRKALAEKEAMLKALSIDEKVDLSPKVRRLLSGVDFWTKLNQLNSILELISQWIRDVSTETGISLVVECFHELAASFDDSTAWDLFKTDDIIKIKQWLSEKRDMAVTKLHLSANILNPKYNGCHLSSAEQIEGSKYIEKIGELIYEDDASAVNEMLCEMAKYRCQEGIFNESYVVKTLNQLSPVIWWKGSCFGLKLCAVAEYVLLMPATTARTERSTRFDVRRAMRENNNSLEQATKLAFVNRNLKLLDPIQVYVKDENMMDDVEVTVIQSEWSFDEISES